MSSSAPQHEHHHGHGLIIGVIASLLGVVVGAVITWLLLAGGASAEQNPGGGAQGGMPPAMVNVGTISRKELAQRFDVVGRLLEIRNATVAAEVEGRVLSAPVEAGDPVIGGKTVLAQIDGVWAKLTLREAEAQLQSAKVTLDQSQRDYDYLRKLAEGGSAKPKEVDDAQAKVESNRAALAAAQAMRDQAQQRVDRLAIVAPFDGAVVQRLVERGQWVSPGSAVAEVISTGQLDAEVFVPEQYVTDVAVGQQIDVDIDALGESASGKVVAVVPSASNAARTFPVKIRLDDRGGKLKAGMSVTAHLAIGRPQLHWVVSRDAVLFSGSDASLWIATPSADGKSPSTATPVPVRVLFGTENDYVIEPIDGSTLTAGVFVVVQGGERLIPGQPLMFTPPSEEKTPEEKN